MNPHLLHTKKATIQHFKCMLATNPKWACRALIVIYRNQTDLEKASHITHENNGIGFNGFDAEILTSFAEQLQKFGRLTVGQMNTLHKKMPKYAGQLYNIARTKS